jgi:hypothetical protein
MSETFLNLGEEWQTLRPSLRIPEQGSLFEQSLLEMAVSTVCRLTGQPDASLRIPASFHLAPVKTLWDAATRLKDEWSTKPRSGDVEKDARELFLDALCLLGPRGRLDSARLAKEYGISPGELPEFRARIERVGQKKGIPFGARLRELFKESLGWSDAG